MTDFRAPESLTEPRAYVDHANRLHHAADGRRMEGDTPLYDQAAMNAAVRAARREGYEKRVAEEREVESYRWPCTARLGDNGLACVLPGGHPNGHSFVSSEAPDRHSGSEPGND